MGLRRRLALCLLTGGLLLGVYMLSVSLEKPRRLMPLKHLSSGSRDPEEPLGRETSRDQGTHQPPGSSSHPELPSGPGLHEHTPAPAVRTQTPTAPQHKAAENISPDGTRTSTEGHMVRQHHGTRTSTEGHMGLQHHGTRTSTKGPMGLQHRGTRTSTKGPMGRQHRGTRTSTEGPMGLQHRGTRTSTEGPKADGPTEPPFIGDSYMREDAPPQTVCPDGVRSRVTNTEFGGRFLDRIPVLQWAGSVTREEHQRLSRYPGGHGWGGIDYKTLVDTLSVLNSSANWRLLDDWQQRSNDSECIRCAVVGNGGILKDSRKGQEIDGHHYVFRTNGAITKGFEQDVGSRTTHYTFSTNTMMNSMRSYAGAGYRGPPQSTETRYVFLPDHDRDYLLMKAAATRTLVKRGPERAKDPSRYFGEDVSAEKLKMYHPDFIRYLRNRFLRSKTLKTKYKDIYRPSTGAVMLLAALHTCDQVSAYGFMTPDYRKYSDHYYDSSYHPVGFFINHDLLLEMGLWQQLQQAGLMRLYMHE